MNIYVGNLPYSVRDDELRGAFEPFGKVVSAEVIFDKRTRRSRGYGFVEMEHDAEGQRAIEALNGKEFHGRELRVDASQPRDEKTATRGDRPPRSNQNRHSNERAAPRAAEAPASGIKGFFKRLFS
ncbi:MAG: RNA-binding protein [Gammaproteobacteria bacterium]|nr:RNA-binding protein [Gammaproteobacteria bacterium]